MTRQYKSILTDPVKFLCCKVLILLFFTPASAQELYSKTYTTKDGLPSSFILNTYQDKIGYLWIGTANGLSRFDGKYVTNFGYSEGLPDLRTDAMLMDKKMRFWAGTRRGMALLKRNKFISYPVSDSLRISYVFNFIEPKNGQLWTLTNAGVYEFDIDRWQKKELYPGYGNKPCKGIVETAEGMYINYGNIIILKKNDGGFKTIAPYHEEGYYYNTLSQYGPDLFISTAGGLCKIKNETLEKLPGALGKLQGVYSYFFDSKKICWIGSENNGLQFIAQNDTLGIKTFYKRAGVNLISGISEDNRGNRWVADFSGLIRIAERGYKIYDLPGLQGKGILRNIIQPSAGKLFINDGTTTLKTFDNGIFGELKLQLKGNSILPKNELIIDNYAVDNKNRFWYAIRGFSLVMQDGNNIYEQSKQLAHLGDDVFDVLFDRFRKKIIIAVRTRNFPCWYSDTGYSLFPVANDIKTEGNIMHLHQCTNGNIVFTTDKGILYSINKQNECKQQFNEFNSNSSFRKFYNDPNGDLWIIYNGRGIRRYAWKNDSLIFQEQIDKTNFLTDDNVLDLCFDNQNNIWLLMNSGIWSLSKISGTKNKSLYKTIAFFNAADLNMEDANGYKLMKTDDGNVWLAMSQHLVSFFPARINDSTRAPGIQIENIKLNLQQTDWSLYADSLSNTSGLPFNLKLPYNKNTLGFYYRAVLPSGTDDIRFSYLLEGLDTSWSPPSSSDFVSFVNLPAGNYIFKVKARMPNTDWSEQAIFIFGIKKAFWETWWFRLLVIMAAASLIVSVFQYRIKQVKRKAEIKNQMHELESKALKAQMNPHFIFNAMNSIQSLIINNRTDEAGNYISKFARLMRHVLENADANLVSIDKELNTIQLYISLEKLRMHVDLNYIKEIDPELVTDQEKIPSLILQPFVENALWHGLNKKDGNKELSIKIKADQSWIICEITDNGIGRAKAVEHYNQLPEGHLSKATAITKQRLVSFNNTPGVQPIEIIDLKDEDGNPAGTTVLIRIRREDRFAD